MNFETVDDILRKLAIKGFAANNLVFGYGSYNYTYVTRDTYGMALKSTAVIVDGEYRAIYKDPKTDNGVKKSQKGYVVVNKDFSFTDNLTEAQYQVKEDMLRLVFANGAEVESASFKEIKNCKLRHC